MSIDEVIEKTTINFSRALTLSQAEKLMFYIAERLPGDVNYSCTYIRSVSASEPAGPTVRLNGTVNMAGTISSKTLTAFDSFQCNPDQKNTSKFSAIVFYQVPGWDLYEYREEVRQLWDDVRKLVKEYNAKIE